MKNLLNICFGLGLLATLFFSCQNDNFYTDSNASLRFSMDTVAFDTVFTSIGSATVKFTVHNPYSENLEINSIKLEGSESSSFRINIDGAPVLSTSDKLLRSKDSMYIFVDVNVDPTDENLPFEITDNIVFNTNGNEQRVLLLANGQNAHHMKLGEWGNIGHEVNPDAPNDTTFFISIDNDTTLKADKPYYLHDDFVVNGELTLEAGVQFYITSGRSIRITGSIKCDGDLDAPVLFRGHRLDKMVTGTPYDKVPGQWGVISLESNSYDNILTHTHIRNGLTGIMVDSLSINANPKLTMANCRVENMSGVAIYGMNADIKAENSVFANCEQQVLLGDAGGRYEFTHCTFANYYSWKTQTKETIELNNYHQELATVMPLEKAEFTNCIIDGTNRNELRLVNTDEGVFNYNFENCLIRVYTNLVDTTDLNFKNTVWNTNPYYDNKPLFFEPEVEWDFRIDTLSSAIDMGQVTHITEDINGNAHNATPDIGAFAFTGAKEEE